MIALAIVAAAVGLGNVLVTLAILRSKSFPRSQLVGQSLIVWLLPALGAIVVWLVLREESQPFRAPSNEANEFTEYMASNYEIQNSGDGGHES